MTSELVNQHSGKCLEAYNWGTSNGAKIDQWTCYNDGNQDWLEDPGVSCSYQGVSFEDYDTYLLGDPKWSSRSTSKARATARRWTCTSGTEARTSSGTAETPASLLRLSVIAGATFPDAAAGSGYPGRNRNRGRTSYVQNLWIGAQPTATELLQDLIPACGHSASERPVAGNPAILSPLTPLAVPLLLKPNTT